MASHSSAGVYVREADRSQRAKAPSTSIGAVVGGSARGPVGQRTLVTSVAEFNSIFGYPDASDRGLVLQDPHSVSAGVSFMHYTALAFLEQSNRLYVTRVAPGALFGGVVVSFDGMFNTTTAWSSGLADPTLYGFDTKDLFALYAIDPGFWNGELSIQIQPSVSNSLTDNTFTIFVYHIGQGVAVETWECSLDYKTDGFGVQLNVEDRINNNSQFIRCVQNHDNTTLAASPKRRLVNTLNAGTAGGQIGVPLTGGFDGYQPTVGQIMLAWDLYRDPEQVDVNILINGGYSVVSIQRAMDDICQNRMDCMSILDTPRDKQSVANAIKYRRENLNLDSSYSALYAPDYLILDQYNDVNIYVPPSGFVAAAYARTDKEKATWFAPAGMQQGRLNINGVREVYNQGDRDALVDSQINPTRVISGAGIRIWGADTLQVKASSLSNVNVRRLMMYIEKGLSKAALFGVFEPGDEILWAQLTDICERFLAPIKRDRGVYGYGIQCDKNNNTADTIASGDVILDLYIDAVIPAKRIYLTAVVNKTGARVTGTATSAG